MALQTSVAPSSTSTATATPDSNTNVDTHPATIPIVVAFLISGLFFIALVVSAIWRRVRHNDVFPSRWRTANVQDLPLTHIATEKPVLWDVWTQHRQGNGGCAQADSSWEKILPVSIRLTEKETISSHGEAVSSVPISLGPPHSERLLQRFTAWFNRQSPSSQNTATTLSIPPTPSIFLDTSVLIALPDPQRKYDNTSVNSFPNLIRMEPSFKYALGVAQVAVTA